jgi:hypothetical protein
MRTPAFRLLCPLCLLGCGAGAPPQAPTLQLPFTSTAAAPVPFNGTDGVVLGTTGNWGFGALNGGTASLTVQSVTYSGDAAMALGALSEALPATLPFNGEVVISLSCTPPAAEAYLGTVSIISNAANTPNAVVYLSCLGTN